MTDHEIFEIDNFVLDGGATLRPARLAYATYGTLNVERSNAILYPTAFASRHTDNEWLIGPGRALDPERYFIIVPDMFGNGLSSSPSNTPPPYHRARFPHVTIRDNVRAQHRLVTERFGIRRLRLVLGWSMAGVQTYQWAVSHPDMVEAAIPFNAAAGASPHLRLWIGGLRAALTADPAFAQGWYDTPPDPWLRTFGRVFAPWGFSQQWHREERYRDLGFASLDDFVAGLWETNFLDYDPNDLLAQLWSGEHADIGAGLPGGAAEALASIKARLVSLPGEKDLYFPPEDEQEAVRHVPDGEVRVIPGLWGHQAGRGVNPADTAFIETAIRDVLTR
ncbi:alpha/beta fold hydrolase [Actinomadura violacea]|uniref:Alpha/beta fold hydrolase n=1 Tax=Actinomadura violacea TaxID=2819934 RepID=A0ABS3RTE3_9ACTN|nr:alpha/beta fold hydrolase [Actinomadura violacea]MBO2460031.1 alpha/beta fold hydrolase [Actinomadura violacea]